MTGGYMFWTGGYIFWTGGYIFWTGRYIFGRVQVEINLPAVEVSIDDPNRYVWKHPPPPAILNLRWTIHRFWLLLLDFTATTITVPCLVLLAGLCQLNGVCAVFLIFGWLLVLAAGKRSLSFLLYAAVAVVALITAAVQACIMFSDSVSDSLLGWLPAKWLEKAFGLKLDLWSWSSIDNAVDVAQDEKNVLLLLPAWTVLMLSLLVLRAMYNLAQHQGIHRGSLMPRWLLQLYTLSVSYIHMGCLVTTAWLWPSVPNMWPNIRC